MKKVMSSLRHPSKILRFLNSRFYLLPKIKKSQRQFFENFFGKDNKEIYGYLDEIDVNHAFSNMISEAFRSIGMEFPKLSKTDWPCLMYAIVRKMRPNLIVETGVWHGVSTNYILKALEDNDNGRLISIDLPAYIETGGQRTFNPYAVKRTQIIDDSGKVKNMDNTNPVPKKDKMIFLPKGQEPGWIISDNYRKRWELILGPSEQILPTLFEKDLEVDIFLHDSNHSYETMMFEFEIAYDNLKKGGLILADNIHWNSSLYDFCNVHHLQPNTYLAYLEDPNLKHPFGGTQKL